MHRPIEYLKFYKDTFKPVHKAVFFNIDSQIKHVFHQQTFPLRADNRISTLQTQS
jgi:hypothetical protein